MFREGFNLITALLVGWFFLFSSRFWAYRMVLFAE